jgi:hypothetical protein
VTADNPLPASFPPRSVPIGLSKGWLTKLLDAIAAQREKPYIFLDAEVSTDRQSRRLLRPLLTCLTTKSGAENSKPVNLYSGEFLFKRDGPEGPIWIFGQFENKPGTVRVAIRRSASPPPQPAPINGTNRAVKAAGASSDADIG